MSMRDRIGMIGSGLIGSEALLMQTLEERYQPISIIGTPDPEQFQREIKKAIPEPFNFQEEYYPTTKKKRVKRQWLTIGTTESLNAPCKCGSGKKYKRCCGK